MRVDLAALQWCTAQPVRIEASIRTFCAVLRSCHLNRAAIRLAPNGPGDGANLALVQWREGSVLQ